MGFKKEILGVFVLVMALGIFFQLSRMDALLHINPWQNMQEWVQGEASSDYDSLGREKFLVVYDPAEVQSVLKRHMIGKILKEQKKEPVYAAYYQDLETIDKYTGIVIATNKLNQLKDLPAVCSYVEKGGRAMVLSQLQGDLLPEDMAQDLGVKSTGVEISVTGIRVLGNIMIGLQGYGFDSDIFSTSVAQVSLMDDAQLEVTSSDGQPMVWRHNAGQGQYLVCNCRERDDKNGYGMYTAMLSQLSDDYIYPVMGMKLFFIDDFPSPVPEGEFDRIYQETGLNTAEFYRQLWWPEMLSNGEKYGIKYTGLIIESYGSQVKGPFMPIANGEARNNLVVYGRELLKAGGELGIHGYNHQSLAPEGYGQDHLGYNEWESQADMEESLEELKNYIQDVYPEYEIHSYVPPSNILSPEGKRAIKNVFPELKVYASLYNGLATAKEYFQNFQINEDGTCEIPRVSSGYDPSDEEIWETYNVLNYNGVFSHFVHPDEIFYEESKDLTWARMKQGMEKLLGNLNSRFPWLEPATASEAAYIMQQYFAFDYRLERSSDGITVHSWNFSPQHPLTFVLRSQKEIKAIEGGSFSKIQENSYIIKIDSSECKINW